MTSLVAGLAMGVGALVILAFPSLNMRFCDSVLGFSGGIILSVVTFGLVIGFMVMLVLESLIAH